MNCVPPAVIRRLPSTGGISVRKQIIIAMTISGGLAGMVVAGMLGDWVLPFFYNVGLNGFRSSMIGWLFLGGLVSLEQMVRSQKFVAAQS